MPQHVCVVPPLGSAGTGPPGAACGHACCWAFKGSSVGAGETPLLLAPPQQAQLSQLQQQLCKMAPPPQAAGSPPQRVPLQRGPRHCPNSAAGASQGPWGLLHPPVWDVGKGGMPRADIHPAAHCSSSMPRRASGSAAQFPAWAQVLNQCEPSPFFFGLRNKPFLTPVLLPPVRTCAQQLSWA